MAELFQENCNTENEMFSKAMKSLQKYHEFVQKYVPDLAEKNSVISFIDDLKKEYTHTHNEFKNSVNACIETQKDIEELGDGEDFNVEELYQQHYSRNLNDTKNESDLMNSSVIVSQNFQIPVDPLSKMPIKNPMRNQICNHVYELQSIIPHIKQKRNVTCPYIGCINVNLTMNQLVEDKELKTKINNFQDFERSLNMSSIAIE